MIHLKPNKAPKLPVCEMVCDKKIHAKLDEYDLTKFLNCHSTNLIIGKPQSGKTNLLYQLFKSKHLLKNCYNKIFLFQPSQSRASMKDKLFDQIEDDQKFEELSLENLDYVDANLDEGCNCLIFDDMTAYLKDNEIRKKLKELVMNRRHKHLSIFFLVQTYYSVEKDIRKLFSNIFIFRVSKKEMENIFDEIIETHKSYIPDITKLVFDKPYKYLFVNTDSQRLFSGFDEIIIDT